MHVLKRDGRILSYLVGFSSTEAAAEVYKEMSNITIEEINPEDHFTPQQIENMNRNILNPNIPSLGID